MTDQKPEMHLENLFNTFDSRQSGYLGKSELRQLCKGISLTEDEFDTIFTELDTDGDNKISKEDFVRGFADSHELFLPDGNNTATTTSSLTEEVNTKAQTSRGPDVRTQLSFRDYSLNSESSMDEAQSGGGTLFYNRQRSWKKFTEDIGIDYYLMSQEGQEEVCDLYQQLSDQTTSHLVDGFENVVLSLVREVKKHECENERLEKCLKREKSTHASHLKHLEDELEIQTRGVEGRVRKEEQERYDTEKEELKKEFESEIKQLQENLKKLQQIEFPVKCDSDDLKTQMEEVCHENRYLKRNLTDVQTNLALQRSELVTLRQSYSDKTRELEFERNTLLDYIKEQESLSRQVHLLQEANQKLHDTNDDLRAALDSATPSLPSINEPGPPLSLEVGANGRQDHNSAYVREYLTARSPTQQHSPITETRNTPCCLAAEMSASQRMHRLLPSQDSVEIEDIPEDFDSGHSTLQGIQEEMEVDRHSLSVRSATPTNRAPDNLCLHSPRKKTRVLKSPLMNSTFEDDLSEVEDLVYLETHPPHIELTQEMEEELDRMRPSFSRANSTCSQCSEHSRNSIEKRSNSSANFRRKYLIPEPNPHSTPERMYKVVLCGDAAVGKSSFIMRLCKNKFVNNLNSTLGVDFQTKTLVLDGRCVALQLWDTAGQERFRSIAKSYFRRADGVLLLYDCSYERSFISVRDWVATIEDGAQKKIPIMLVANKTDIRESKEDTGTRCVKTDEGQRLAKEFEGVFIETSAKSGSNIQEAALEFARLLKSNEDLEVKTVGMQLHEISNSKSKSCCN